MDPKRRRLAFDKSLYPVTAKLKNDVRLSLLDLASKMVTNSMLLQGVVSTNYRRRCMGRAGAALSSGSGIRRSRGDGMPRFVANKRDDQNRQGRKSDRNENQRIQLTVK